MTKKKVPGNGPKSTKKEYKPSPESERRIKAAETRAAEAEQRAKESERSVKKIVDYVTGFKEGVILSVRQRKQRAKAVRQRKGYKDDLYLYVVEGDRWARRRILKDHPDWSEQDIHSAFHDSPKVA